MITCTIIKSVALIFFAFWLKLFKMPSNNNNNNNNNNTQLLTCHMLTDTVKVAVESQAPDPTQPIPTQVDPTQPMPHTLCYKSTYLLTYLLTYRWASQWHWRCLGLVPSTRTRQVLDSTDVNDHDNSRSQTSRSRSGPMRLYFNMAELTDGARRSHVHVKAATLRLHWTGHLPPLRSTLKQASHWHKFFSRSAPQYGVPSRAVFVPRSLSRQQGDA